MKFILTGLSFVLLLMLVPNVSAQIASTSATPKRETFQKQLQQFKDQKRLALVDRIVSKMSNINKQRTDQMMKVMDRMNMILDKLKAKVDAAKTAGKDTTEVEAALKSAQDAITAAETAISNQAAKDYTPTAITEDTNLRNIIGTIVSQLQSDLQTTHKLVVDAKQALMKLAQMVMLLQMNHAILSPSPVSSSPSATPIVTP